MRLARAECAGGQIRRVVGRADAALMTSRKITFVKKILANGQPCGKCRDVEERLTAGNHWRAIDRVVIADERDPDVGGNAARRANWASIGRRSSLFNLLQKQSLTRCS